MGYHRLRSSNVPRTIVIDFFVFQVFEEWEEGLEHFRRAVHGTGLEDCFFDTALDEFLFV